MTDANVTTETVTQEPDDLFAPEADINNEERKSHDMLASGDFPPSLISYFETSKSRATLCEKLLLEEVEDFTTSYEDLMNSPTELDKIPLKLNEQDKENENASADSCLLPETEAPVTANVTASPRNEDERLSEFSLTKEKIKEIDEHQQAHKEKCHFEELTKEEQIRRRENDFQIELKKLMEAEKLHQIELQLMEKRAQEKLEQELLLQQELISNLQKHVEEERRMMAEELKRMKAEEKKRKEEEENRKKMEEEKIKRENQWMEEEIRRKRMEEENIRNLERRAEERRLKEEQRKKEEEERKREEVKITMEEEKRKREEESKKIEEEKIKREVQGRKIEEGIRRKKEEERKITEVEPRTKEEEEEKTTREVEKGKVEEEMMKFKKETKIDECKKMWLKEEQVSQMEQMEREINETKMENKSNGKKQEEEEVMQVTGKNIEGSIKKTNEDDIRQMKEWRKEEGKATRKESERTDAEVTKELEVRTQHEEEMEENKPEEARMTTDERMGKREEDKQRPDGTQLSEDEDKRRKGLKNTVMRKEEEKIIQEEWRKRPEENDDHRNMEEEIRASDEEEHKAKIRKEDDNEIEKESGEQEEKTEEEVSERKEENTKAEGQRLQKEEGSKITRSNELQENNSVNSGTERETAGGAGPSPTSQLEDSPWSSGLGAAAAADTRVDRHHAAAPLCRSSSSLLPCPREQKRLSWMKDCISWRKLSLQNRRKQKGSLRGFRLPRRPETSGLPPLCPDTLLQSTGCRSFQQVTSVTLEDLPGCNVSTLALCSQLQSLALRRCGLTSLDGISQLSQLCYIDVTENHISFVDCENMTGLRVLRLGYNQLTSIHGLRGADNLDELELSHNNITRIAGLESVRRLQRLSVDHNQLISTKGLRDVCTLLHLNCSHNHLAGVEGLESSALLNTLDLRSNSLSEPPSLDNHVLLRELHLDDNSISSLQGLAAACWLPLMQNLSVAQNRITRLPSMSGFVSLAHLDLQFNCMSELHNVCESLEGCLFLQDVHLRGNPLQQENGWRSTLQRALPGLRAIDDQQTHCVLSPPAVQQISLASDPFLNFCQAQLQQMNDLRQQHSRELSEASSSLDAVNSLCRHFTETLKLAEDQRFAHEYGDITASEGQTVLEGTADTQSTTATKLTEDAQMESSETVPAVSPSRNKVNSSWTFETSPTESWFQALDAGRKETDLNSLSEKRTASSSDFKMAALSDQDPDLKNTAAIVIQQQWRKCRQKHGDISRHPLAASEGDGANPEPGPSCGNQHDAATVIQASWRGFSVRRRLASALAAVTFPSTREDDTFEEVDMDEFVFDEAELEKHWTLPLSDETLSRHEPVSEQPPSVKFPGPLSEPSHHTLPTHPVWRPKQAWVPEEQVDPDGRVCPESSHRKSPASSSVLSRISERSEKILEEWGFTDSHTALQMLKRAQNMKWKQQHKKKHKDPSARPALFYQLVPVEARNRAAPRSRNDSRGAVCRPELQQPEKTEPVKQESAQQRLRGQSDRSSQSERFLPELSSDILNGGRVQLVADPVYSERHRASGQRTNSGSSAQQHNRSPHGISLGQSTTDAPSPNRVAAAPSVKERISFRDSPAQLSGGWGGGKKRNNMHK